MCRWIFYYGEEVCIAKLIFGCTHGLATMSHGAGYTPGCELNHNRNHPVNVHGCGIGWYACEKCGLVDKHGLSAYDRPTVYTTVAAPSHDRNLRSLSKTISTSLLFGHVRAAGPGASVHQYNCHPFRKGRYMFMHNGEVVGFKSIRRGLLNKLRDELFEDISGTTDSELLFNLILNELPDVQTRQDTVTLQRAVLKGICAIISACKGKPSSLNVALTDGETVIATRYRNSEDEEPPSLYFHLGPMPGERAWDLNSLGGFDAMESNAKDTDIYGVRKSASQKSGFKKTGASSAGAERLMRNKFVATQALLVSSEPLSGDHGLDRWQLLPPNSMIVAAPTRPMAGRCTRSALVAKLKEEAMGGGKRHNLTPSSAPVLEIEIKSLKDVCKNVLGGCPEAAAAGEVPSAVAAIWEGGSDREFRIRRADSPTQTTHGGGGGGGESSLSSELAPLKEEASGGGGGGDDAAGSDDALDGGGDRVGALGRPPRPLDHAMTVDSMGLSAMAASLPNGNGLVGSWGRERGKSPLGDDGGGGGGGGGGGVVARVSRDAKTLSGNPIMGFNIDPNARDLMKKKVDYSRRASIDVHPGSGA